MQWIANVKKICSSLLPYILCVMLLLTSSCFWRFDRDGHHDGHDQNQHHDHERYDRQKERESHSMNIKHQEYKPNEISRQSEDTYQRSMTPDRGAISAAVQKTIAVVESHGNLRCLYELELQDEGYKTISLAGHAELFTLLADKDVNLVISGDDGREQELLELVLKQKIPLIINTGDPSRYSSAPGDDSIAVMIKSSDTGKLKNKIRRMLAHEDTRQTNSLRFQQEAAPTRHAGKA